MKNEKIRTSLSNPSPEGDKWDVERRTNSLNVKRSSLTSSPWGRVRKGIVLLFAFFLLGACDEQTVYHFYHSISPEGWDRNDTLRFPVDIKDSLTQYNLLVGIRNCNNYPYRNLSILLRCTSPDSTVLYNDTLQFFLANEKGDWTGKGIGLLYQTAFPIGSISIKEKGEYLFTLNQVLPDSLLPGISDVGIKLCRNPHVGK